MAKNTWLFSHPAVKKENPGLSDSETNPTGSEEQYTG
jgi:hypothetical protein